MRKLYKASLVSAVMVALLVGVYFAGYRVAYERYIYFHIDVGRGSLHTEWLIERLDGTTEYQYHAGIITLIGFDYLQDRAADSSSGVTEFANIISLSTSAGPPSDAWTEVPLEITTGGLARVVGTYTRLTAKSWTLSYQFTATATHTNVQMSGIQWKLTPLTNNLFGADLMDPVSLNDSEKLTVTATVTLA